MEWFDAPKAEAATSRGFYSNEIISAQDRKDPKKVGGLFEAMFYRLLFKEIRNSSLDEGMFDSSQMKQMQEMRHDEMANHLGSFGHLGISDLIEQQLEQTKEAESLGLLKS